ncbi:5-oxoprolinase subunit PxpA [Paraflavitalea sp. CAU 1676]|uniref:5-oxoprolinase subunit PxpA n=1 Tax=Paraflavitalea sp. CAU 1676 TaxID=3032598 RepID=UPI0023DBE12E|nr:5-oxoprolinase subunit PxpA [Paraflavitalea sp. CAU 1676]MDF2192864.1 LamB/YcsF family protein [Paraflavitalea sp. CAU 1676]
MVAIDLNCDMGESTHLWQYDLQNDLRLLPWISSMNLACGFHAGDPQTMHDLISAALDAGVAVGAHPSFYDRENFGRTNKDLSPEKVYDLIIYQVGALQAFLQLYGASLHHVKPHGALYNMAAADPALAAAICRAVKDFDSDLILYGLSGSELMNEAELVRLEVCHEVFADRTYQSGGLLTPRSQANALITDEEASIGQVLQMVQQSTVNTVAGEAIPIRAETICLHSDGPHALAFAQRIHNTLKEEGIDIRPR